jgi:hypothetical protein
MARRSKSATWGSTTDRARPAGCAAQSTEAGAGFFISAEWQTIMLLSRYVYRNNMQTCRAGLVLHHTICTHHVKQNKRSVEWNNDESRPANCSDRKINLAPVDRCRPAHRLHNCNRHYYKRVYLYPLITDYSTKFSISTGQLRLRTSICIQKWIFVPIRSSKQY